MGVQDFCSGRKHQHCVILQDIAGKRAASAAPRGFGGCYLTCVARPWPPSVRAQQQKHQYISRRHLADTSLAWLKRQAAFVADRRQGIRSSLARQRRPCLRQGERGCGRRPWRAVRRHRRKADDGDGAAETQEKSHKCTSPRQARRERVAHSDLFTFWRTRNPKLVTPNVEI